MKKNTATKEMNKKITTKAIKTSNGNHNEKTPTKANKFTSSKSPLKFSMDIDVERELKSISSGMQKMQMSNSKINNQNLKNNTPVKNDKDNSATKMILTKSPVGYQNTLHNTFTNNNKVHKISSSIRAHFK